MGTTRGRCYANDCEWINLQNITGLPNVPPLRPNPELSGVGVILGFSLTAYLTLGLLILHYLTVHDFHRTNPNGEDYINCVDRGIILFTRERILSWRPSRRFEYAMEKAVLILSDTQLVTGLAILISGYSQLNCGISAYHWQIMVYIAWFSSFSFLSAMAFLEGYFLMNNSLRIIRVCFMFILATLLIVALLPTGSHNWLNLLPWDGGFYPSLNAICYFKQLSLLNFSTHTGPKLWSMIVSIIVVALSYIRTGIRLFDPTAGLTRQYLRAWPEKYLKRLLHFVEKKSHLKGIRAYLWKSVYLLLLAGFVNIYALYDIAESMLLEIAWLTFAVAWGTIKLYETRRSAGYNSEAEWVDANEDVLEENSWSFGQILPLVLLLLPVLCMTQAYLDNDAKVVDDIHRSTKQNSMEQNGDTTQPVELSPNRTANRNGAHEELPVIQNCIADSIARCNNHSSRHVSGARPSERATSPTPTSPYVNHLSGSLSYPTEGPEARTFIADRDIPTHHHSPSRTYGMIPTYPYSSFADCDWYHDHLLLLIFQILVVTGFALYLLNYISNFLGLTVFFRNRLFLMWVLAVIPAASLIHLTCWYLAGLAIHYMEWDPQSKEKEGNRGEETVYQGGWDWWRSIRPTQVMYWVLRMAVVGAIVIGTFFASVEIAGSEALMFFY